MRRPSPALVIALLALFVALGGPAEAKKLVIKANSIGTRQIKDKSVGLHDVSPNLINRLRAVADRSVTSAKLADGNVTTAKLADAAITGPKLADNSVTGKAVRNGTLDAKDIGGFAGSFKVTLAAEGPGCTGATSDAQKPLVAGQDLSNDAIVLTPSSDFPGATTVVAKPAGAQKIHVTACGAAAPTGEFSFRYVTIDVAG